MIHDPIYDDPCQPTGTTLFIIFSALVLIFFFFFYLTAPTEEQLQKCAETSTFTVDECKIILTQ